MDENPSNDCPFQILKSFLIIQILAIVVAQDLKTTKSEMRQNFQGYDMIKKEKIEFPEVFEFLFCPIPKVENSEISESFVLLQILRVVVTQELKLTIKKNWDENGFGFFIIVLRFIKESRGSENWCMYMEFWKISLRWKRI